MNDLTRVWVHWTDDTDDPGTFARVAPRCEYCSRPITGDTVVEPSGEMAHASCARVHSPTPPETDGESKP